LHSGGQRGYRTKKKRRRTKIGDGKKQARLKSSLVVVVVSGGFNQMVGLDRDGRAWLK
jgi:hypothetical protein